MATPVDQNTQLHTHTHTHNVHTHTHTHEHLLAHTGCVINYWHTKRSCPAEYPLQNPLAISQLANSGSAGVLLPANVQFQLQLQAQFICMLRFIKLQKGKSKRNVVQRERVREGACVFRPSLSFGIQSKSLPKLIRCIASLCSIPSGIIS